MILFDGNSLNLIKPQVSIAEDSACTGCPIEGEHLKIGRLGIGIEHFSLDITQSIHNFHQYIFTIGPSILKYRI
jgi:hypothetical protein